MTTAHLSSLAAMIGSLKISVASYLELRNGLMEEDIAIREALAALAQEVSPELATPILMVINARGIAEFANMELVDIVEIELEEQE